MDGGFFKENQQHTYRKSSSSDDLIMPLSEKFKCKYCKGVPISSDIKKNFGIHICRKCVYSELKLITKTECKKEYLLTEEDIRQFRHISRPNPRRGTWSEMQLFMRDEIVEFSYKKYGTHEKVEEEKKSRLEKVKKRKIDKIKQNIRTMKKRTFLKEKSEEHKHVFETVEEEERGICKCGMEVNLEYL